MSTTDLPTATLPPLTAEEFAGTDSYTFCGVTLQEDEDGDCVFAWGHIDPDVFADAVSAYNNEVAGPIDEADRCTDEDVHHAWAVTLVPADDPGGWRIDFRQKITADTPGAFPLTVVFR